MVKASFPLNPYAEKTKVGSFQYLGGFSNLILDHNHCLIDHKTRLNYYISPFDMINKFSSSFGRRRLSYHGNLMTNEIKKNIANVKKKRMHINVNSNSFKKFYAAICLHLLSVFSLILWEIRLIYTYTPTDKTVLWRFNRRKDKRIRLAF